MPIYTINYIKQANPSSTHLVVIHVKDSWYYDKIFIGRNTQPVKRGVDISGKIAFLEKNVLDEITLSHIISQWEFPEQEELFIQYKYLARLVKEKGQRGFIGKVNMDCNSPENYIESLDNSVKSTEEFVKYVLNLEKDEGRGNGSRLVYPIITPRFAITCTSQLMNSLGLLAKKYNMPIQSHLSENIGEINFISELFPHLPDYTTVYDHHGLLNEKTIMAHGIHLSSKELKLIKERNIGISHCPTSNFAICSGVCNVRQLLDEGIKVGLGTDLSGGYSKSILNAIRNANIASRVVFMASSKVDDKPLNKSFPHLTLPELTYLATMGGAELVNLDKIFLMI
ncbi:guanine deaminase [Rhizophagus irregularis DAOM 181602=DAOM 197198]|nr:guanine deaminase [Rhizophagus irregularis DAOM 181602=DAOM 197198]